MIINVCEEYAPTEEKATEARKNWICRSLTLDLMYDNIPGLNNAALDTKNFIYDELKKAVEKIL